MSQPQQRRGGCWMLCGLEKRWESQLQRNKETALEKLSRKVSSVWLVNHGQPRDQHGQVLGMNRGGVPGLSHQQQFLWLQQWHCRCVSSSRGGLLFTRTLGTLCEASRISRPPSEVMLPRNCPTEGRTLGTVSAGAIPAVATTQLSSLGWLCFQRLLLATTVFHKCWVGHSQNATLCYLGTSLWVAATFAGRRRRRHRVTLLWAWLGPQVVRKAVCLRAATPRELLKRCIAQ